MNKQNEWQKIEDGLSEDLATQLKDKVLNHGGDTSNIYAVLEAVVVKVLLHNEAFCGDTPDVTDQVLMAIETNVQKRLAKMRELDI